MKKLTLCLSLGLLLGLIIFRSIVQSTVTEGDGDKPTLLWWKGNVHTHTLNSDGDSPPGVVSHWYRDHDYDFLVLSDHNYYTGIEELQREFDRESGRQKKRPFLLIPGEEVTDKFGENAPIHINGIDTTRVVGAQGGKTKREMLQRNVDAIHAAGGIPSVNHPNYHWAITADDFAATKNLKHFEIFNGSRDTNNFGAGGHPGLEEVWDDLLSRGVRLFGVAVDDAHHFKSWGLRLLNPGSGWIAVRAAELSRKAIRDAFDRGDFYSSTGVTLEALEMDKQTLRVSIERDNQTKFMTSFIGEKGRVLSQSSAMKSEYTLKPGDNYVRARVFSSRGEYAWTQPLFATP